MTVSSPNGIKVVLIQFGHDFSKEKLLGRLRMSVMWSGKCDRWLGLLVARLGGVGKERGKQRGKKKNK